MSVNAQSVPTVVTLEALLANSSREIPLNSGTDVASAATIMDMLAQNIRFAFRTLRRNRLFAIFAIVTLGLGIGANTAIFSVIDGVLLKPLPYASGDRLVVINQSTRLANRQNANVSIKELYDYREKTETFDALVEYHQMNFDLLRKGNPDRVNTGVVSHDFFNVLGIKPIYGRTFLAADDEPGADAVLVLSHSYWEKAFGSDPAVVGKIVEMNDRPHTIVGVLPSVPLYPQENDVYMSVSACPFRAAAEKRISANRRAFAGLTVFGRIKDGQTHLQADADVKRIAASFVAEDAAAYRPLEGFSAETLPVREQLTRQAKPVLLILFGTTGFVLLIACVNIANLSLARLLNRERELAVRAALGAGRRQLVAQLLTESTVLSLAGGAAGLFFAAYTVSMLTSFAGRFTSRIHQIEVDPRVLLFALVVSIATGVLFGMLPALQSKGDLLASMKQGGTSAGRSPSRGRLQKGLIVTQVAFAVILLVGAGLLLATVYRLQKVDLGYHGDHVVSAEAFTNFSKYPTPASQVEFYDRVLRRLADTPGVISAAVTNAVPLSAILPGANPLMFKGEGDKPDPRRPADVNIASPGYFATLGIPLLEGRDFVVRDIADSQRVAIVNAEMAKYWNGSPLGREVSFDTGQTWVSIVGVTGDTRQYGMDRSPLPEIFIPLSQSGGLGGQIIVRTAGDPSEFATALRGAVQDVDPDMPVKNIVTLPELRDEALTRPRLTAALLLIFALIALTVTLAGVSGLIAISVTHRLKEFGVRMALGASRAQVLGVVVKEGLALVTAGLLLGIAGSFAVTRSLSAYLYETHTGDPMTLMLVCLTLLLAGLVSCLVPAMRATAADPVAALRSE
jgi:putative ABC transport system permease protein